MKLTLPTYEELERINHIKNLSELELAKRTLKKILIALYEINWIDNFNKPEPFYKSDADCLFEAFDKVLKIIKKLENKEKK